MNPIPRLMLVTDPSRSRLPLLDLASEAVAGGVDAIYLRTGEAGVKPTPDLICALRERIGDQVTLLVNDAEVAAATDIGTHLRERDAIPARGNSFQGATSRRDPTCLGMTLHGGMTPVAECSLVGRSVHSPEEAAASVGMHYLLAGHVYPSASKPGKPPLGLTGLRAIVAAAPCPVLAIGGIMAERVAEVIHAGAHGIAVIGAIAAASDPRAAATALRAALDQALRNHKHEEHF